ncbi:MAG: hypothetical protein RDU30_00665 [Desulfovibrionaceae bacterium]|nr:hypothetical protein [Desulfovibrionaceae bacterium]
MPGLSDHSLLVSALASRDVLLATLRIFVLQEASVLDEPGTMRFMVSDAGRGFPAAARQSTKLSVYLNSFVDDAIKGVGNVNDFALLTNW